MEGMLESRPDWCISRQRSWGISIPAFQLPDGSVFMTAASSRAIAAVFAKRGSDAWFTETPAQLLADYKPANDPESPRGLDVSKLTKMYDILDVWFESGSSWNSVMRQRDLGYPADLYCEGSDQHRGWFQASLLPSLGVTGQPAFRGLVTHGFTVDKDGRKMSKSEGNTIEVEDLLKSFGADVCRWWVSSLAYENDIKADLSFFEVTGESYRKVRNTLRFLLSNLADFSHGSAPVELKSIKPTSLDGYILQEAAKLQAEVTKAYEEYEFRRAHQALYDFCNDALSAFYCFAMKDRLYCDRPDSLRRRITQTVMWELAELLCRLLAPILPHSADEAWRALWKDTAGKACVHLEVLKPLTFMADPDWPRLMAARDQWLKAIEDARQSMGIENPLDCGLRVPPGEGWLAKFDRIDLADMCGISRFELTDDVNQPTVIDLRSEPRCERSWKRDGTVRQRSDGGMLSDRDAEAVGVP
jgi:isoleucyl-tRNA synthetase